MDVGPGRTGQRYPTTPRNTDNTCWDNKIERTTVTVESYAGGGDMAGYNSDIGLEDFDTTDVVAPPRINIVHADGQFEVNTTKETFTELDVIFLGLVKQRIMWHPDIPSGEAPPPMCKSTDFQHGFPEMDEEVAADYRFPWEASNFTKDNLVLNIEPNAKPALKCSDCKFKEWGTDPKGDRPWCSEDWVLPLLYRAADGSWQPAIVSFKRSSLKNAKQYMGAFATSRMPLWSVVTRLSLDLNKRGSVRYSTPKFQRTDQTDQENWPEYLEQFRSVREYLRAIPKVRSDDDTASGDVAEGFEASESPWGEGVPETEQSAPAPKAEPQAAAPKGRPKPPPKPEPKADAVVDAEVVSDEDDDEDPPF